MRKTPKPRRTWSTADWVVWVEDGEIRHYPVDSERGREIVAELGGEIVPSRHRRDRAITVVETRAERSAPCHATAGPWAQLELFPEDTP